MKKWKKLLAGLLATALSCMPNYGLITRAEEDSPPQFLYEENADGTVAIKKYQGDETEVEIPSETEDGRKVTSIGEKAFSGCSGLTKISIPNSVGVIGGAAFSGCSGLTEISIPNSVGVIGGEAFSGCSGLTEISIPAGVTELWAWTFHDCSSLSSVTIPPGVAAINGDPFFGCKKDILKIYGRAGSAAEIWARENGWRFMENEDPAYDYQINEDGIITKYTGSNGDVVIPSEISGKEVIGIGTNAFSSHAELNSVTFPIGLRSIGNAAFSGCSSLTEISIPASVTSIGKGVFSDCSGLAQITVEEGNTQYDSRENCNAIIDKKNSALILGCKNTLIPASVKSIAEEAFSGCSGLAQISIPASVTSIADGAFLGCSGLTQITVAKGNSKYDSRNSCNAIIDKKDKVLILGCKNTAIPAGVLSIGGKAFSGCSGLTQISIPSSVLSIGGAAFSGCSGLTEITIPKSVSAIGGEAFSGCSGLTEITIPNSVANIWAWTFRDCGSLASVTIPPSVTEIYGDPFYGCNKESLTIHGLSGSEAETYAKSNNLNFEIKNDIDWAAVALSRTSYIYDRKPKTPSVTVKLGGKVLALNTDYTVSYSNNTNAGTAKVIVTGKDNYIGSKTVSFKIKKNDVTCKKTLYKTTYGAKPFKIKAVSKKKVTFTSSKPKVAAVDKKTGKVTVKNTGIAVITVKAKKAPVKVIIKVRPKRPSDQKLEAVKGRKLKVSWTKDAAASGYQVQISTNKNFKKDMETKNVTKASSAFTKLKSGKRYYVRIRSYKKSGKETLYSAWSKIQNKKIKR